MARRMGASLSLLAALPVELARRRRVDRGAEVFRLSSGAETPEVPSGSLTIVSGDAGSELVARAREAARRDDAQAVAAAIRAHAERLDRLDPVEEAPAAGQLAAFPAITQVAYHGKVIAEGLIVHPRIDALRVLVPFAGGALDEDAFVASTHVDPAAPEPDIATLVIVREPVLTALERRVLERLPREMRHMAVGRGDIASAPGIAAGLLMAEALTANRALTWAQRQDLLQAQEAARAHRLALVAHHRDVADVFQRQLDRGELDRVAYAEALQQRQREIQDRLAELDRLIEDRRQLLQGQQREQRQDDEQQRRQEDDAWREEQQRQESEQREAEAAEVDAAGAEADDDGGRLGFRFREDVLSTELEALAPGAAVARLVDLRTRLMLAGRLR